MHSTRSLTVFALAFVLMLRASTTFASPQSSGSPSQTTAVAATSAVATQDDDDAVLQPAQPDFRVINMPTTLRLPRFKSSVDITHRFAGNLRRGSFSEQASRLFGIDEGAVVGFEYRFAIARHVQAVAYRTAIARTIQLYGKYDAINQTGSMPLSVSALVSIEGADNLQEQYAPAIGASVSRMFGEVATLYAVPIWVHHSAAATGVDRDSSFLGVGGRLRIRPTVYLAAEMSPRLSGYAPGTTEFGFAIEKRAGGHLFQLNFTNTTGSTFAQIARGGTPASLSLGFNLTRKFF